MPSCTICRFEVADESVAVCPNCGAPIQHTDNSADRIEQASPFSRPKTGTDQSTSGTGPFEATGTPQGDEDSLEICDPGEFIGAEQNPDPPDDAVDEDKTDRNVVNDQTAPPPPTDAESKNSDDEETELPISKPIQKLSDEQINSIRSSMMGEESDSESEYATPEDASLLLHNLRKSGVSPEPEQKEDVPQEPPPVTPNDEPVASAPPPSTPEPDDQPEPKPETKPGVTPIVRTTPIRNIAYFHKNFIQLTGNIRPVAGAELRIDNRTYVLRQKRIKPKYAITAVAVLAAIFLFIIGKQFISPTVPGNGTVVGVILDNHGRPLVKGIKFKIPEIGKTAVSDGAGFFHFDDVATGTYIIEYTLPDGRVGTGNVSVAANEVSTITMSTADAVVKSAAKADPRSATQYSLRDAGNRSQPASATADERPRQSADTRSTDDEYSDLRLAANVNGAKLIVNGETLGRGNTTYRKLMPGTHSATVIKDGYRPWKGKITLKPGEIYTLSVTLEKAAAEKAEPQYTADDFYQSGKTMLGRGDPESAIRDLTEAVKMDPSMADAYYKRAQANEQLSKTILAESDYVRAGEIYRTQKRMATALEAFNRAIEINPHSVPALLDRGDIYMLQDNKGAAMDDYQAAVKADNNNFAANFDLGKAYFALGKYKDAEKRLRKAKDLDPSVPDVYHYLMLTYFARDDFNDVKRTYSDFKQSVSPNEVQSFRVNPRYDAIVRVIGNYDQP